MGAEKNQMRWPPWKRTLAVDPNNKEYVATRDLIKKRHCHEEVARSYGAHTSWGCRSARSMEAEP